MRDGDGGHPPGADHPREVARPRQGARPKRRDRHGRGLRGVLAPPDVPLHRTRAERFDDLVLQAVERLESRWEPQLAGIEFAVEEIPPASATITPGRGLVPLSRLDRGPETGPAEPPRHGPVEGPGPVPAAGDPDSAWPPDLRVDVPGLSGSPVAGQPRADADGHTDRPRIVVYRRPLMARADSEEDLGELVFDVVVEEFARLMGLDPEDVDPGYSGGS
ncbi:MAG TPA: metallopeptidase family protein [Streptosporangiaceae bacterium]|nr:metallopeptidase family protein [Streptosporangiaceae bacterium]